MTKTFTISLLCLIAVCGALNGSEAAGSKPNIIFVLSDDQGYNDLGCYGSTTMKTPNIDQLAAEGMKLTSYYVHNRCSPTRAAFMTGCIGARVGISKVVYTRTKIGLHDDEVTIAELLQEAGYVTGHVGKWHLGDYPPFLPNKHGFSYSYAFTEHTSNPDDRVTGITENGEFVEENIGKKTDGIHTPKLVAKGTEFIRNNKDKPFFLYYASPIPHTKWIPHPDFAGTSEHGAYGDVIQELDWQVGELMKELETHGLTENTLIMFTSDNGPQLNAEGHGMPTPLRDGKWTNFEGGIRVPTVVRWPAHIAPGSENNEITAITDMLPTFAALAGVEVPTDNIIDGHNILPYLTGAAYDEPIYDTWIVPGSTIRKGDWKLFLKGQKPGGSNADKRGMTTRVPAAEGSLFNLATDISESTDVSAEHPEIVEQLRKLHDDFETEYRQNLREPGRVPGE